MTPEELTRKEIIALRRKYLHRTDRRSQERLNNWVGGGWMPLVCGGPVGQVSGVVPLVSPYVKDLVSGRPPITLPRHWGIMPSRKWGKTGLPKGRHRRAIRPVEMGTFAFLTHTFCFWAQPALAIYGVADDIREQSEKERDEEARLNSELLELKMRYEMEEISEEEFKRREKELHEKLKDLRK